MRVAARETAAAIGALVAYVVTVLPGVRRELRRWRKLAEAIPDPERRRQALASLEEKRSNVEAVAVFATLAPLRQRQAVLRAIVPLQLAIDYRDTLEEAGEADDTAGNAYLAALETSWVREIDRLSGCSAVAPVLHPAVDRCSRGQRHTHAAAEADDPAALQRWASTLDAPPDYRWWEVAAGASSSVAAHALIAAAAGPATNEVAAAIDAAYFPATGALTVFLDDLVDRESDAAAGQHNYLAYYEAAGEAAERIGLIADRAGAQLESLPRASRHRAILAGVGGFYLSAPEAKSGYALPIRRRLFVALGPSMRLLANFMRLRRLGGRREPG